MALDFNGTSNYASLASVTLGNIQTIMAWVKFDALGAGNYHGIWFHSGINAAQSYGTTVELWSNASYTGGTITTGTWYHIAIVRNGTAYTIYLDGTSVGSGTAGSTAGALATLIMGAWDASADWLDGAEAYLRIWNGTAMTQAQVAAEMDSASAIVTTNLYADWPLVADLLDDSGNARTLSFAGTPSYISGPTLGAAEITGSAALAWAALPAAGAGAIEVQGAGAITFAAFAPLGEGTVGAAPAEGVASLAWTVIAPTGTGAVEAQGSAGLAWAALTVIGIGTSEIRGTAALGWSVLTVGATGVTGEAAPNNWNIFVGAGFTDVSPKQVVRTLGNILYTVAVTADSYPDLSANGLTQTIRVYKANSIGVPTGFTRKDSINEPVAATVVAAAIDGAGRIHIAWVARASASLLRYLRYAIFDTSTDTWGSVTTIASDLDYDDVGQGDQAVALVLDAFDVCHVVYLGTAGSGVITNRRVYYRNNSGGTWSAATQVDSDVSYTGNLKAWHPNIVVDRVDRRWVTWERASFNGGGDGTLFSRVYSGSWAASVQSSTGGEVIEAGIDQSTSMLITPDGRWHIAYILNNADNALKYIRYHYSDDQGATWSVNNPTQATHNPALAWTGSKVRIYAHGTPNASNHGDNLYYMEGDGGAAAWGAWTLIVTSPNYDSSVNTRWSLFNFNHPSTQDIAYWNDAYPNDLYAGTWILAEDIQGAGSVVFGAIALSGTGTTVAASTEGAASLAWTAFTPVGAATVEVKGVATVSFNAITPVSAGTVGVQGAVELAWATLSVVSVGTSEIRGTVALEWPVWIVGATGVVGAAPAEGVANLAWAAFAPGSAGTVGVQGVVELAWAALTVVGVGTSEIRGTAALGWSVWAVGATGAIETQGLAVITWPALVIQGAGVVGYVPVTGDAIIEWAPVFPSGSGAVALNAAADIVWTPLAPVITGAVGVVGSSSLVWGSLPLVGQVGVPVVGDGALAWGSLGAQGTIYVGPMIIAIVRAIVRGPGRGGQVRSPGRGGRVHSGTSGEV